MPADDFQSLIDSVQTDGFIDPIVRIHEGQILDGWHRYRAAQELNLIRRLKFQEWDEDEHRDGDPKAFVLARNIERRHLSASQRAQITVAFNERFGHGGDRGKMQDCNLKTQQDLADQANVSKRTIATAVQVEKAGQSEAVIAGEKTAIGSLIARKIGTRLKMRVLRCGRLLRSRLCQTIWIKMILWNACWDRVSVLT